MKRPVHFSGWVCAMAALLCLHLASPAVDAADATRGQGVQATLGADIKQPTYHALIVGINQYTHWTLLKHARRDSEELAELLRSKYGFTNILTLYDREATLHNMDSALRRFVENLGEDDALLIYYAGHGFLDEHLDKAYWVPADAAEKVDGKPAYTEWFDNTRLKDFVRKMKARHVLVVCDSCFSGAFFDRGLPPNPTAKADNWREQAMARPSRFAMTSGALQTVPDESIFAYKFRQALRYSTTSLLAAEDIASEIQDEVFRTTKRRLLFRPLDDPGGSREGQFVFVRKPRVTAVAPPPAPPLKVASVPPATESSRRVETPVATKPPPQPTPESSAPPTGKQDTMPKPREPYVPKLKNLPPFKFEPPPVKFEMPPIKLPPATPPSPKGAFAFAPQVTAGAAAMLWLTSIFLFLRRRSDAESKPKQPDPTAKDILGPDAKLPTYHALIISIGDYQHWPGLRQSRQEAEELANLLRSDYGFADVRKLCDRQATQLDITLALRKLTRELGPDDALLIYFAGHGYHDKKTNQSYWVPADAREKLGNERPLSQFFDHETLEGHVRAMKARHVLVASDACFVGKVLYQKADEKVPDRLPEYYRRMLQRPGRYVVSNGDVETTGTFARQFRQALQNPKQNVFTSSDVAAWIRGECVKAKGRLPLHGPLKDPAGGGDGEFVFARQPLPVAKPDVPPPEQVPNAQPVINPRLPASPVPSSTASPAVPKPVTKVTTPPVPTPATATKDNPWVNTLGMKFVPVPGTDVLFSAWHTRVQDYAVYAAAHPGMQAHWKDPVWKGVAVTPGPTHPVVNVSWEEAKAFCAWLTEKERSVGKLTASQSYRLPQDWEWSVAVGLNEPRTGTPEKKSGAIKGVYPWGKQWPPPKGAGNFNDESLKRKLPDTEWARRSIAGYDDGYVTTAPVGSFLASKDGLHDLSGNVSEWCEDRYYGDQKFRLMHGGSWVESDAQECRVTRGGSWADSDDHEMLLSSLRGGSAPNSRGDVVGFRVVLVAAQAEGGKPQSSSGASATFAAIPATLLPTPPTVVNPPQTVPSPLPLVNSLGMKFVPVPGTDVLFSVWHTRVQDFAAFVKATGHKTTEGMYSLGPDGWKQRGDTWESPGFKQGPTHPVCGVSWEDAQAFAKWLTAKEQGEGKLTASQGYRLPQDWEWSVAVGLNEAKAGTPHDKNEKIKGVYPWGTQWPPPTGAGNYAGEDDGLKPCIEGYWDGFPRTSPVGSLPANRHGLYDMGGNLWQWCLDCFQWEGGPRTLRGGAWVSSSPSSLLSSRREHASSDARSSLNGFRLVLFGKGGALGVGSPALKSGPGALGTTGHAFRSILPKSVAVVIVSLFLVGLWYLGVEQTRHNTAAAMKAVTWRSGVKSGLTASKFSACYVVVHASTLTRANSYPLAVRQLDPALVVSPLGFESCW